MKYRLYSILLILIFSTTAFAQKENKLIRKGNKLYKNEKYQDAEIKYRKSLAIDSTTFKGQFNLGDAMYKQKNYQEAAKIFNNLTQYKLDNKQKAKVFHNLGNSLVELKKYPESISSYKNALKYNPKDKETKYNLAYAQKKLKKQQQQQKKNKDKNKNKDKKKNKKDKKQNQDKDKKKQKQQQQKQQQELLKLQNYRGLSIASTFIL